MAVITPRNGASLAQVVQTALNVAGSGGVSIETGGTGNGVRVPDAHLPAIEAELGWTAAESPDASPEPPTPPATQVATPPPTPVVEVVVADPPPPVSADIDGPHPQAPAPADETEAAAPPVKKATPAKKTPTRRARRGSKEG